MTRFLMTPFTTKDERMGRGHSELDASGASSGGGGNHDSSELSSRPATSRGRSTTASSVQHRVKHNSDSARVEHSAADDVVPAAVQVAAAEADHDHDVREALIRVQKWQRKITARRTDELRAVVCYAPVRATASAGGAGSGGGGGGGVDGDDVGHVLDPITAAVVDMVAIVLGSDRVAKTPSLTLELARHDNTRGSSARVGAGSVRSGHGRMRSDVGRADSGDQGSGAARGGQLEADQSRNTHRVHTVLTTPATVILLPDFHRMVEAHTPDCFTSETLELIEP
jgi:hypothetical protein